MTIGEGILIGLVLFGFLIFASCCVFTESKQQRQIREFRESVKSSLNGIREELNENNNLKIYLSKDV